MATSPEAAVPHYVGAAFAAQFSTSFVAGILSLSILSGDVGEVLSAAGTDATRLRLVVLLELLTSIAIVALTSLLYVALRDSIRWVATVACACWLAEATVLAVSTLGLYTLLDVGGTRSGSGSAVTPSDAAVGQFALGLHEHAGDIAMLLYAAYVPFELVVGIWLLVKGSPYRPEVPRQTVAATSTGIKRFVFLA